MIQHPSQTNPSEPSGPVDSSTPNVGGRDPFDSEFRRLRGITGISGRIYRTIGQQSAGIDHRPIRLLVISAACTPLPIAWLQWSRSVGREFELTLIDLTPSEWGRHAIDTAIAKGHSIRSLEPDSLNRPLPSGFDIVASLYWMHRLREDQAFRQLQSMLMASHGSILVCDHARSRVNAWIARLGVRLVSSNPAFRNRAVAEVETAYSISEFKRIAESALPVPVEVRPIFPGHFIMVSEEPTRPEPIPAFA